MRMSTEHIFGYGAGILWFFLTIFGKYWAESATGYLVGNRFRFIAVLRLECILTCLNIFAHKQLMYWFDEDSFSTIKADRRKLQTLKKRCSRGIITFLVLGQAIYFMYYMPAILQLLLFDITSLCAGIWTNMIAFLCGFGIVNFMTDKMKSFSTTSFFLKFLGRIPFFNSLFLNRKSQLKFTIVVTLILSIAMYLSRDWIVVKHKTIEIKNFSAKGNKLRVAVLSDLHAGASVYKNQIDSVVEKVLENDVDAVLIVGDVVDAPVREIEDRVKPLLVLPTYFPTYFVTGNHEYYYGNALEWIELYKKNKIHVLDNDCEMLNGVCISGVNDISSTKIKIPHHDMNLKKAVSNCSSGSSIILMSHNPASIVEFSKSAIVELSRVDLIVSGHTHAGQFYVVVPVVYWLLPYFYGLYEVSLKTQLMVTAGSLYQGPPMKMIGMAEVWVLDIVGV